MALGWQEFPSAQGAWQITYDPTLALLTSNGESILFHEETVYRYDAIGSLVNSGEIAFAPKHAFLDAQNRVLVHNGENVLGRLLKNNGMAWQRQFPVAQLPPFNFGKDLVYIFDKKLWLIDTETGWIRYSLERDEAITAVAAYKDELLIADQQGRLLQWDPQTGRRLWFRNKGKASIKFLTVGEDQSLAIATDDGQLEVLGANRKVKWRRQFHIEIAQPPLWFEKDGQSQWVIATHGRHYYAFGNRGKLISDYLLPNRPMLLTKFNLRSALLLPFLSPTMVWYDAHTKSFNTQTLPSYQSLVIDQVNCLLTVGADGQIRLYQKTLLASNP